MTAHNATPGICPAGFLSFMLPKRSEKVCKDSAANPVTHVRDGNNNTKREQSYG